MLPESEKEEEEAIKVERRKAASMAQHKINV